MSLTAIKPWFRARFDALRFKEHVDVFNIDNVGELDLDHTYHIAINRVDGGPINQLDQKTSTDVSVHVFFKGGRNASEALDFCVYEVEQIIKECCNIKSRTSDGILNVVFQRAEIQPRGLDNDSSILVTIDFTVMVLIGVEEN